MLKKHEKFYYGGDYNPEQWDESVWKEDMRLMKKAGVNYVSINIFSWARLQPDEETYDFSTLDKIMDMLAENGIGADLATATAAPPAWLSRKYPDSLPVDKDGSRFLPGSRQHYCPNSKDYARLAAKLVRKIAERYKSHPALVMWHVNNEYGCHISECYCDHCKHAFQQWLKEKYGTIENLNQSWSTDFWSQRYYEWEEICLPGKTPTFANPMQQLDYKAFMDDSLLALYKMERDILKAYTPDVPVMTNLMGLHKPVDGFHWAKEMDLVTWDAYPDPFEDIPYAQFMAHDLTRSLKKQPFLLMEQAAGAVNWRAQNAVKAPGVMRLWSYEAAAHGADGIMFFQWRASQGGAEKFHSGMVPHSGDEESRNFREVVQLGNELKNLEKVTGSAYASDVAIVFDWKNWWALELDSKPSSLVTYIKQLLPFYRVLHTQNIGVDFIHPDEAMDRYKVVFAPASYRVTKTFADKVKAYVENGGYFATNFFSGIADENDRVYLGGYPGAYRDILGIYVEEFAPMKKGAVHQIRTGYGDAAIRVWEEKIHLKGAEALAWFKDGYLAGSPAVTAHHCGKGKAYYIGTQPDEQYLSSLLKEILKEADVRPALDAPRGVEVAVRKNGHEKFLFLLNHTDQVQFVDAGGTYPELIYGRTEAETVRLSPRDVKILQVIEK
ncbi:MULTISPECIES: beta-galactosidase [Heyndrickxia]|uniref:beta-galactosidase n=1 Tax=Heyndrickxia TaxID=2837504 RepID=UPI002DBBB3FF|nr:beta-galactosidase [Weizmannia sp. CD-2023]MEC2303955.1 beta-galactosidase [Weizmannia sp. CD-2023]MEC2339357.1 beta-galactosidase [Weizmannia sp. CD-2023]MED4921407.1 beta-galactosidase [Weizmannia sp. CD-2023]